MKSRQAILLLFGILCLSLRVTASGPVGVYGIIEKVIVEPDQPGRNEMRFQLWGAFAYVDGAAGGLGISEVKKGYLYFTVPNPLPATELAELNDLKAVAGTGQAVGFGKWGYTGTFESLQPAAPSTNPPHIFQSVGGYTDLRVRDASEAPAAPARYQTNAGVVKLPNQGSHSEIIGKLRAALQK